MILLLTGYRTAAYISALMIELAKRAQAFIERETGLDRCPNWAMQLVCDAMACDLMGLVNGGIMMRTYNWWSDLEARRIDFEALGVSREDLIHLGRVVHLEMGRCMEIARVYDVEIWGKYGCLDY